MDRALPQKFPFILDSNLAKANCTENQICTSCDEVVLASGIRQGCTASTVLFKLITYKIIEEMRETEGIQILGPKITCLFYADDGLILAKDKEKAERSIEIIKEIGGKYGLQLNERKSQCILFNMKEKCEKISIIEVVEERNN